MKKGVKSRVLTDRVKKCAYAVFFRGTLLVSVGHSAAQVVV